VSARIRNGMRLVFKALFKDRESGWTFAILISALYAVLLGLGQAHHEFWRDETHPWVLARYADGFGDIATGDRVYDGHPPFWYWYLHVWTWFTHGVVGLHLATMVAETCAGFILLRWGPFPRLVKVLLLCGYLLGYEYGIMSRNYTMGVVAAMAFAATYRPLRLRALSFVFLACLALSSVYGLIMAAVLLGLLVIHNCGVDLGRHRPSGLVTLAVPRRLVIGGVALLLVFAFAVVVTSPPDPNPYSPDWAFHQLNRSALWPSLQRMIAAFVTLRKPSDPAYWIGASQYSTEFPNLYDWATYALPLLIVLSLIRSWPELGTFILGFALMSVIMVARYVGHIRHWGSYFVLFLVVSWIARVERPKSRFLLNSVLLFLIGLCQLQGFVVAYKWDWKRPFSGAEDAAKAILRMKLQDLPLVIGPDWSAMALTAYLDRTFISSETEEINQTMVFHGRRRGFSVEGLIQKAAQVSHERHSPVLVISNRALPRPAGVSNYVLLYQPALSPLMGDETFWVYRVDP